jgi:hypothetical protein
MNFTRILAGLAFAASFSSALATPIASDDFQSYGTGDLNTLNGGSGSWTSAWVASNTNATVVDPAIDLAGNRALRLVGNNDTAAYRSLTAFTGNDLYISFLVQVPSGTSVDTNDFLSLWLENGVPSSSSTNRPNIGLKGNRGDGSGTDDVFVRTTGSSGSFVVGSNLSVDTTYHIVGHLYRSNPLGNYTNFDAWLDPSIGDLAVPEASFVGNAGINQINRIGFRTANLEATDKILIDKLMLGTAWNDVVTVSEPGMLALFGLGLFGLAAMRRRKS